MTIFLPRYRGAPLSQVFPFVRFYVEAVRGIAPHVRLNRRYWPCILAAADDAATCEDARAVIERMASQLDEMHDAVSRDYDRRLAERRRRR
jgi:hypothetical protein